MKNNNKVVLIGGSILVVLVIGFYLLTNQAKTEEPELVNSSVSSVISSESVEETLDDDDFGTTVIVSGGKTKEAWEPLVKEKLIAEYKLAADSQFEFVYDTLDESPMGSLSYQVVVDDTTYEVSLPGPNGFMFDTEGSAIESEASMTDEDWLYNVSISLLEESDE